MTEFCDEFTILSQKKYNKKSDIMMLQCLIQKNWDFKNWKWYLNNINGKEKLDVRLKFLEIYDLIVKIYLMLEIYNLSY